MANIVFAQSLKKKKNKKKTKKNLPWEVGVSI